MVSYFCHWAAHPSSRGREMGYTLLLTLCSSLLKQVKLADLSHVYTRKSGIRIWIRVRGVQLSSPNTVLNQSYIVQPVCTRKCRQLLKGYISFSHTPTSKPYCSIAQNSNTFYKNRQHSSDIELQPSFNWLPALSHFLKLQIANTSTVIPKCVLLSAGDQVEGFWLAFWNINMIPWLLQWTPTSGHLSEREEHSRDGRQAVTY